MHKFRHRKVDPKFFPPISDITTNSGRLYVTPEGKFPSITTVLSKMEPASKKAGLKKWRTKIGDEEADRITKESQDFGTMMHKMLEDRLNNVEDWKAGHPENVIAAGNGIIEEVLEGNVTDVILQEVPLFSPTLKIAGRIDVWCTFNDIMCCMDFKNKRQTVRNADWIHSYFLQTTFYSMAIEERMEKMTGKKIPIPLLVIPIADRSTGNTQLFIEDSNLYRDEVREMAANYHKKYSIAEFENEPLQV